ncbi:MAG: transcriptional regulator [Blastocatellia bacterium AA13]|nr:MAG: transcriptional regulator [Blastocatellia bacterium AA13]
MIDDSHGAAAMLDPTRKKILEELRTPDSASGVARKLGLARQKVNYHLRQLEKRGLVEAVEERRKGNCTERIVRATARYYLILPQTLGQLALDPSSIQDLFSSTYLVAVASQAIQDLAHLRQKAKDAEKKLATLTLRSEIHFASAAARNAFAEELANDIARLIKKHDRQDKGSRRFKLFLGMYPAIAKKRNNHEQTKRC